MNTEKGSFIEADDTIFTERWDFTKEEIEKILWQMPRQWNFSEWELFCRRNRNLDFLSPEWKENFSDI